MNNHLANLARRRLEILRRIEVQRMEMADISAHLHKPLLVVGMGLRAVRLVSSHPVLVVGGLTALLVWRKNENLDFGKKWWQILYCFPSLISFGLKSFFSAVHTLGEERKVACGKTRTHQIK